MTDHAAARLDPRRIAAYRAAARRERSRAAHAGLAALRRLLVRGLAALARRAARARAALLTGATARPV